MYGENIRRGRVVNEIEHPLLLHLFWWISEGGMLVGGVEGSALLCSDRHKSRPRKYMCLTYFMAYRGTYLLIMSRLFSGLYSNGKLILCFEISDYYSMPK